MKSMVVAFVSCVAGIAAAAANSMTFDDSSLWKVYGNKNNAIHLREVADADCPAGEKVFEGGLNDGASDGGADITYVAELPDFRAEQRYEISCWMKSDRPGRAILGVNFWHSGFKHYYRLPSLRVDSTWIRNKVIFTTPTTNDYPILATRYGKCLVGVHAGDGIRSLRFAGVTIRELPPKNNGFLLDPPEAGLEIPPNPVRLDPVESNGVVNSSFELGDAGWGVMSDRPYLQADTCPAVEVTVDRTAAVHGSRSLRIDTVRAQRAATLLGPSVPLVRTGDAYAVSAWLKASKPCTVKFGMINACQNFANGNTRWWSSCLNFNLSNEWRRVSVVRKPPEAMARLVPCMNVPEGVTVWVDAVQFEHGEKPSEYAPAAPAEAAFVMRERLFTMTRKSNGGFVPPEKTAELRKVVYASGDVVSEPYRFKLTRYGVQSLTGTFAGRPILPATYCVLHERGRYAGGFALGVNGGLEISDGGGSKVFCGEVGEKATDVYERLRLAGVRHLRLHDCGFAWPDLEPEKGVFRWELLDSVVARSEEHGMKPIFVLGNGALMRSDSNKKKDDWFVRARARVTGTWRHFDLLSPRDDDWRDFVAALAGRYGTRLVYEVVNEPNLQIPDPAEYSHYLALSYDTVKAVAPGATVIGICATGDFDGKIGEYVNAIGNLGGFRKLDMMSFHPYSAPMDFTAIDAMRQMEGIRQLVDKFRPGCPIVDDELYYLADRRTCPEPLLSRNCPPGLLARRYAMDLAAGCVFSAPAHAHQFRDGDETHPAYRWYHFCTSWAPSDLLPVSNAFAHFLEGASLLVKPSLPDGLNGFVFRARNGCEIAYIWAVNATDAAYISPNVEHVFDHNGNPLDGSRFRIDRNGLYLAGGGLAEKLASASVAFEKPIEERRTRVIELFN